MYSQRSKIKVPLTSMAGIDQPRERNREHIPVNGSVDNMVHGPVPSLQGRVEAEDRPETGLQMFCSLFCKETCLRKWFFFVTNVNKHISSHKLRISFEQLVKRIRQPQLGFWKTWVLKVTHGSRQRPSSGNEGWRAFGLDRLALKFEIWIPANNLIIFEKSVILCGDFCFYKIIGAKGWNSNSPYLEEGQVVAEHDANNIRADAEVRLDVELDVVLKEIGDQRSTLKKTQH